MRKSRKYSPKTLSTRSERGFRPHTPDFRIPEWAWWTVAYITLVAVLRWVLYP